MDQTENTLESQQVEVAGKYYLTNFNWLPINKEHGWEVEAKERSEMHKRPLCLLRLGRMYRKPFQYGLHESINDCKIKKLPRSLALSIVNGFPDRNYLGFFALETGFWICAVRGGQLMLQGDYYTTSKEEAIEHYKEIHDKFQWTDSTVFDFSENKEESIAELSKFIAESNYANRNGYLDFTKKERPNYGALFLILLLCAGGVAWWYQDLLFPKETIPPKSPDVLFPKVWEKLPPVWDTYMACEDALNSVPIFSKLWTVKEAVCNGKNLNILYVREKDGSYIYRPKDTVLNMSRLDQATRNVPVKVTTRREKAQLLPQEKTYIELREFFRIMANYNTRATIVSQPPESTQDGDPPTTVRANFARIKYTIVTTSFPREIFQYIAKLPGATLESLKTRFAPNQIQWEFVGTVYVNYKRQ